MVGGEQAFSAGGYTDTPIEEVLPVRLPPYGSEEQMLHLGRFPLELTEAGLRHPIMTLSPSEEENRRVWAMLPDIEGANRVLGPTPGAVVLGVARIGGAAAIPLVVVAQREHGRSMAMLSDSTWRWTLPHAARGGDLRSYTRFWSNAIRWLIQDPEQKLISLSTDEERYPPDAQVRAELRVLDRSYRPAPGVSVTFSLHPLTTDSVVQDKEGADLPAEERSMMVTDEEGRCMWTFPAGPPGVWRVAAVVDRGGHPQQEETIYLSGGADPELQDVMPREDLLVVLARETGGTLHHLPDSILEPALRPPRVLRVRAQESHPLWTHPIVLFVALALLGLQWWLRRGWGFL